MSGNGTMVLVDLWSVFWNVWFRIREPIPVREEVTRALRALKDEHSYFAVALDGGKSWREYHLPEYSKSRVEKPEAGLKAYGKVVESLRKGGVPLLAKESFESRDMIASAVEALTAHYSRLDTAQTAPTIVVKTGKKSCFQLVRCLPKPEVIVSDLKGEEWTDDGVLSEYGVEPKRWSELAAVSAIKGIGPKKAAQILTTPWQRHASAPAEIPSLVELMAHVGQGMLLSHLPHSQVDVENAMISGDMETLYRIAKLKDNAGLDGKKLLHQMRAYRGEEQPIETPPSGERPSQSTTIEAPDSDPEPSESVPDARPTQPSSHPPASDPAPLRAPPRPAVKQPIAGPFSAIPRAPVELPAPEPQLEQQSMVVADHDWTRELEPRSACDAKQLAKIVHDSRLFAAYGNPQAAFLVIMAGREFGLGAMASLRSFHVVEGRPCLSAQAMMGLCVRHSSCLFFRVVSASTKEVVVEALRQGWPEPNRWTFSWEDAERAGLAGRGNWRKYPRAMLTNRCIAEAARFWFPDVVGGLYDPDELAA